MTLRSLFLRLALVAAVLAVAVTTPADNWPQWRGPNLDGSTSATGLPLTWSPTENVAWKLEMPARSGSTPVVWGDRLFLSVSYDPESDDRLELWTVDAATGKVVWKRSLGGGNELRYKQHMSTPSPVTDGQHVWVLTGTGILKAFDLEGAEIWSRDLQKDYGPFGQKWGYASSPLLHEDSLYVQVLHGWDTDAPSYVLRIDASNGKTVWRVERPTDAKRESPDAYTTPALLDRGERFEIVVSGGDVLTGHDPKTGLELWRVGDLNPADSTSQRLVASPLVIGDRIFAFGKRGPILAFRATEESKAPEPIWSMDRGTDVPTPTTDGEHLYVVNDGGIAWCLNAKTGEIEWGPERVAGGTYSASPVLADGRIYAINEAGVTTVLRAGPEFEILAENDLDSFTLSSPAIADGRLFLRTEEFLYALDPEAPKNDQAAPEDPERP